LVCDSAVVRPNKRLKLPGAHKCRAPTSKEELRCLAGEPFFLRLHRLAPAGARPAA